MKESVLDECWLDRSLGLERAWLGVSSQASSREATSRTPVMYARLACEWTRVYFQKWKTACATYVLYYCTVVIDRT